MSRVAVKHDFRMYIRRYTSPNENFEYGYPHSNALLHFLCKLECSKPGIAARHPRKCDVINDVKLFLTVPVYRRIYCRKLLTLSNQMWRYKSKCIRIFIITVDNHVTCGQCANRMLQRILMENQYIIAC